LDTSKYQDNKLWFMDPAGQYVLRIHNSPRPTWRQHHPGEPTDIKTWHDLLNPAYKGKIVMYIRRLPARDKPDTQMWKEFGPDFIRQLFVDQQPFISRDHRRVQTY